MKHFPIVLLLLLATFLPLAGQNNPYELDDECYPLFQKAETLVGKDGFEEVNAAFLRTAVTKGDTKSQTLYYIERLKHFIRLSPTKKLPTPEAEEAVLKAFEEAKSAADRFGFPQYFYYAYELVQNFYYNHKLRIRTFELVQEMQQISADRNDAYGQWMGYRYLVALYIAQSDYMTAKQYILKAIEKAKALGKKTGVTLKPGTPAQAVKPFAEHVDLVLIMTVEPGFGGQSFMHDQMAKVSEVRKMLDACNPDCELEVDGGVDAVTAALCKQAGANVLVAGSAVFGKADRAQAIRAIRNA